METLRKTTSLAVGILALVLPARAATPTIDPGRPSGQQANYRCVLASDPQICATAYREALHDSSPGATSIRDAYERYARYLTGSSALTDADRQFLKTNQIALPNDLSAVQTSGLHNVINDAAQKNAEDRKDAAINFLSRAEEANIYCGFQSCKGTVAS
jgi:hypothetical protein